MKQNLNDLQSFLVIARAGSFTKAAAQLGVSQSALSHAINGLEKRLQIKLFHRTTRSISTTEAGEQLYRRLAPLFDNILYELDSLNDFRSTLQGNLRINGNDHAFAWLWTKFQAFLSVYPDVTLETVSENRFVDIVAERFDAGIRLGDDVAKDMIAVRISPDMTMACVASPDYLVRYGIPKTPHDLTGHTCLAMRLMTLGGLLNWEFRDPKIKSKTISVQPHGKFISNNAESLKNACSAGLGLLWTPQNTVQKELDNGLLKEVLSDWKMQYQGYHLYYPNRRENSPLLKALTEVLRENR